MLSANTGINSSSVPLFELLVSLKTFCRGSLTGYRLMAQGLREFLQAVLPVLRVVVPSSMINRICDFSTRRLQHIMGKMSGSS